VIACVSSVMGIGGGTLSVPAMTLTGSTVHAAVGTAAFFGLLIAAPGTVGYLLAPAPADFPLGTIGLGELTGAALRHALHDVHGTVRRETRASPAETPALASFRSFLTPVATRMLWRSVIPHRVIAHDPDRYRRPRISKIFTSVSNSTHPPSH
jgi:hypothetical protein